MFSYHDFRASIYCKILKSFFSSTSIVNIQNDDNYCFLWSISAHNYKVDNHRERVSQYKKHFHELHQSDIQFPMKRKDKSTFERLNNLNINVFELSAFDKTLSPKYVNNNFYDEEIDLLLYENHYCLITNLHNFFWNYEHYNHLCRRCLNTYGDQTKLEELLLRCIEQNVCNKTSMHPNQKIKIIEWYFKIESTMWMAADFECMNLLVASNNNKFMDKLFLNKPVALGYNVVKNTEYENLNLEKDGYIKFFVEDYVE